MRRLHRWVFLQICVISLDVLDEVCRFHLQRIGCRHGKRHILCRSQFLFYRTHDCEYLFLGESVEEHHLCRSNFVSLFFHVKKVAVLVQDGKRILEVGMEETRLFMVGSNQ